MAGCTAGVYLIVAFDAHFFVELGHLWSSGSRLCALQTGDAGGTVSEWVMASIRVAAKHASAPAAPLHVGGMTSATPLPVHRHLRP